MRPHEHFAAFCESLTQSEDRWEGEPLILEPWQKRFWKDALDGDWRSLVLLVPRKNGKTQMLAAYAVYELVYGQGRPEILLAAASDRQAGRLFDAAARFVRRHEGLSSVLRVRDHEGTIVREDGLGSIIRLTSDPNRLYGYSPTLVICDELAFWNTPNLRRAYAALTSGGGARTAPRTFTITTAGPASERHDGILGRILDAALETDDVTRKPGLTICRLHEAKTLVYEYAAPTTDPRDTKAVKLANPASWITEAYLRRQAENPELTDAAFLQLHANVWAATETTWIPPGDWAARKVSRSLEDGEKVILGFDGSYARDATSICAATLDGFLSVLALWERPEGARGWKVPRQEVDDAVAAAMTRFEVLELACDPPGWHAEIDEWRSKYGDVVLDFPTNVRTRMGPACDRFRVAVLEGDLSHDGDPDLARHVGHCVAKETPYGVLIGKDHPASPRRIDAAVAACVAFERAMWHRTNHAEPVEPMWAFV